jgi:nucleoside-diphosphate-sugar epimerase
VNETILVTGATGALGTPTVRLLRERLPHARLVILARSPAPVLPPDAVVLRADFAVPGLANAQLAGELREITHVIHVAADVRWNLDLRDAVRVNAVGTWWLLRMLRGATPRLRRFVYVSTAFAEAPGRCRSCRPSLRLQGRCFNNPYEFSKSVAERYVRGAGLPWSIVRPSLIVGDSATGRIARYNGIYQLLQLLVRGRLPFLVGDADGVVDMVPVDLSAWAVFDALTEPAAEGRILLVGSGIGAPTLREVVDESIRSVNDFRRAHGAAKIPWPAFVNCETYRRLLYPLMEPELLPGQRRLLQTVDLFHPYLGLPRPLEPPPGALLYTSGSFQTYGRRVITAWCQDHPRLATTTQRPWVRRPRRTPEDVETAVRTG